MQAELHIGTCYLTAVLRTHSDNASACCPGAVTFQPTITKTYNTSNLLEDIKGLYKLAGLKGQKVLTSLHAGRAVQCFASHQPSPPIITHATSLQCMLHKPAHHTPHWVPHPSTGTCTASNHSDT